MTATHEEQQKELTEQEKAEVKRFAKVFHDASINAIREAETKNAT